ncbi:MAG: iron ABC transporter permease [Desulfovibrio sp.]|nr:iron ABC transporter permease [Desulfovibrio sp.]
MPAFFGHRFLPWLLLLLLWLAVILGACFFGSVPLSAHKVCYALLSVFDLAESDSLTQTIVVNIRLARILLASLAGSGLALAGVCLQGVLKNDLAEPFTLGISQGAACGASLLLTGTFSQILTGLSLGQTELVAFCAFLGSLLATVGTLLLGASRGRMDRSTVILAGIAMSTFLGALLALIKALNEESIVSIVFWIMGSFQGRTWDDLPLLLTPLCLGLLILSVSWRALDMFFLGDMEARQAGLNVQRARLLVLVAASLMTAGCVAVAGIIGFVGLVVPHILRLLFGPAHAPLLCGAVFGGGILLVLADLFARTLLPEGQEIPVGVVTALIGGPFFAWLLKQRQTDL